MRVIRTVICIVIILSATVLYLPSAVSAQVETTSPYASGTVRLTDEERAWLDARNGVIRLAPDPAFPPLEWFDEWGAYRGFVADCFRLIEERLGVRIEIVRCRTWDEVLEKAKLREIDGITAAQITPERKAYLSFTKPLVDIPNVIITRHEQQGMLEFGSMKDMSLAITSGNALHEYLRDNFPYLRLFPHPDDLACLHEVSFGRADATVINLAIAAWLIEKHGISNLRVAGDSGKTNQLAIACRNDQPQMLSIMSKGLSTLSHPEQREIYGKWVRLEGGGGVSSEYLLRLLGYAAMALTAVLTVFFVWNRALQSQVALRTDELQAELAARREVEKALTDEKERLAVTLTSIGEGVITTDTAGRVTMMNRIASELTGWNMADAAARPLSEILPLTSDTPSGRQAAGMIDRNGARHRIASTKAPILDGRGSQIGTIIVFQDVTVREEMERELQRTQKLESLGVLAGGIAHDFNNILTGILGHVSLAKAEMSREQKAFTYLAEAESSIATARGLTRQLLTFARGGTPQKRAQSIRNLLEDSARLVMSGSPIRLLLDVPGDLRLLEVDEGQIGQAIQNLVINARQSMKSSGTISISAANIEVSIEGMKIAGQSCMKRGNILSPGKYVEICVSDEGCGIPPEVIPHLFDPFFTTKQTGHGLGLSTVFSIIDQHGGHITVDSTPGTGSIFRVYLPATDFQIADLEARPAVKRGDGGRILVMDDDKAILSVMQGILRHLGYQCVCVPDGSEAISEFQKAVSRGAPFQLAILDLTIRGGMGGLETAEKLHELEPGLRIMVASGYSSDPVMADHTAYGFCHALSKPFMLSDVEKALACVFGDDSSRKAA